MLTIASGPWDRLERAGDLNPVTPEPATIDTMDRPYRVCFVCMGNICRSPMAEAVLRRRLAEAGLDGRVVVDSAGTGDWHVGEDADPRTHAVLRRHGYTLRHRARQFTAQWFAERDLVIALDRSNHRQLRALAPDGLPDGRLRMLRSFDPALDGADLDVPDPYFGDGDGFARVLAMVETACDGLVDHIRREVGARQERTTGT